MAHNILSKVDRAIAAYLAEAGIDRSRIYAGKLAGDKAAPAVIVYSERAELNQPPEAIYEVSTSVHVKTIPAVEPDQTEDEVKELSEDLVGLVFDALFTGLQDSGHELGELITAAGRAVGGDLEQLTITEACPTGVEAGFQEKGNAWIDTLTLKLIAVPRNVS